MGRTTMHYAHKPKGFSLVELLIASSIGLIALSMVVSVFLQGNKFAAQRSLELMLSQDMSDALRMMKEDILRAGFASGAASSFIISGADKVVYTKAKVGSALDCLTFAYDDGTQKNYRSYYFEGNKLKHYATTNPEVSLELGVNRACSYGQSMLHDKQVRVVDFHIVESQLSSASATSQMLTLVLEAALSGSSTSVTQSVTVKTRNWN